MKLLYVLPILCSLFVGCNCMASCDCAEELKNDPVFMKKIIESVRQDLVANPDILQDMANAMQKHQNEKKNSMISAYIRSHGDQIISDAPVLGNRDAKKTIFIWTDFSCPYCRRVHGELARVLKERDDVRVVIKNFSIHGDLSDGPAKAVIAAKIQNPDMAAKFADLMMNREFYSQEDLKDQANIAQKVESNIMKMAQEVGLDTDKLKKDMTNEIVSRELSNVRQIAQEFDIKGTPFLIIEEKAYPGAIPYDQIIDALK